MTQLGAIPHCTFELDRGAFAEGRVGILTGRAKDHAGVETVGRTDFNLGVLGKLKIVCFSIDGEAHADGSVVSGYR